MMYSFLLVNFKILIEINKFFFKYNFPNYDIILWKNIQMEILFFIKYI